MPHKTLLMLGCMMLAAISPIGLIAPLAAQASEEVKGTNVTRITFGPGAVMSQVGPGQWQEYDPSGRPNFRFEERSRDEWSVYLYDASRNMRVQVDLFTRTVAMVDEVGTRTVFAQITGSSAAPVTFAQRSDPFAARPAPPMQPTQPSYAPTQPAQMPVAPPTRPPFTTPAPAPAASPATPSADDEFDPFADPADTGAARTQTPTQTLTTPTRTPATGRDVITAAANRPSFTVPGGTSAAANQALNFDGPWVAQDKIAESRGDGLSEAVTWTFRDALWITTAPDGSIMIHFDANPAGSLTLAKIAENQYSGSGHSARFDVISKRNIRLTLTGGGGAREYAISTVPSGVKLSRSRIQPESDDEIDTFTAGNLVPRFNEMFVSFRAEKMDLFNANRGQALRIFAAPNANDFSIESNFQSKTIPYGLRATELRRTEGSQQEAVITNAASFEKSMSLNFGASGSFKGISGGWEVSREESKGADRSDGTTKAFGLARAEVYALLLDKPNMVLDPGFKFDILQLADGRIAPAQFIAKYGTHYANAIHYGGIGKAQRLVTTSEFKQWARESTGYKQEGGFDGGPAASFKAKGGLTMASGESRGGNSMFSKESWSAAGGSGSMTSLGWNVDDRNTVPVRYDLRPLSELISPIFFGPEWSTPRRTALLAARSNLDNAITRYLQSQPKPDDRQIGPVIYQVTFHSLKCLNNGDEGTADAYLFGDITALVNGIDGTEKVNLFSASPSNATRITCNGGADLPINRTAFVTAGKDGALANFSIVAAELYEDDNSFTDPDDPLGNFTPTPVFLSQWRADRPRTDIPGTQIGNLPGTNYGPDLRIAISFQRIQ